MQGACCVDSQRRSLSAACTAEVPAWCHGRLLVTYSLIHRQCVAAPRRSAGSKTLTYRMGQLYSILGRHCLFNSVYLSPAFLTPPCSLKKKAKPGHFCLSFLPTNLSVTVQLPIDLCNHAPARTECLRRVHAQHRRHGATRVQPPPMTPPQQSTAHMHLSCTRQTPVAAGKPGASETQRP